MKLLLTIVVALAMGITKADESLSPKERSVRLTTAERIAAYNYPVETHQVQTSDGYVLTMFRIPYSPKLNNKNKYRPVVLLQHGLQSSSDCWILNGPNNALAYLLADAGYDVWMGNARGNIYSKKNIKISYLLPKFWDFSWNEIAITDMPAMIDYVLERTNEKALHYVGHSQGTTVFFVLMSSIPSYNKKIKTSHMLAPVAYMEHLQSPLIKLLGPLMGKPSMLANLIGSSEFLPSNQLISMLGAEACRGHSIFQPMCGNMLFLCAGWDSEHLNYTLMPDVMETHPAGSSTRQLLHYLQEYLSGYFRKYDYGKIWNILKYGSWSPPKYVEKNIVAPVRLYYSDNDYLSAVIDVQKMEKLLPNLVESFHVPHPKWNHLDFLFALEVKQVLYDRIIGAANRFERTGKQ